jgi:5-methylcytosine-specific restriction endonuclease McrA
MYSASNILSIARTYYIPKKYGCCKPCKHVVGKKKTRFYYNDRQEYRSVYLKSDHWKSLRSEKLSQTPYCEECESKNVLDVHHKKYKNLYDVLTEDLQTLCRRCHTKKHVIKPKLTNRKIKKFKRKNVFRNRERLVNFALKNTSLSRIEIEMTLNNLINNQFNSRKTT